MSANLDTTQSGLPLAATPLFGFWTSVMDCLPVSYDSVIVWGTLENETSADSHEGHWNGRQWKSARDDEFADADSLRKLNISASYWMPRPCGPNAERSGPAAQNSAT